MGTHRIREELLHVETISLDALTLDPKNANRHGPRSLDEIQHSLTAHGQRKPIVVQKRGADLIVRAGNGTVEAARVLGWTHVAAVVIEEGDDAATRYGIADNFTADHSEYDEAALGALLQELEGDDGLDVTGLGMNEEEAEAYIAKALAGPDAGRASRSRAAKVISYTIVFESVEQQAEWTAFLRYLREHYPEDSTIAARIVRFIESVTATGA